MQVFIRERKGFLASRLVLGLAEAGYIPGAVYTLSTWYTKRELAKRVAILFFGMFGGNAISPLLASGILKLDNVRGIHGWQWLFISMLIPLVLEVAPLTVLQSRDASLYLCPSSFSLSYRGPRTYPSRWLDAALSASLKPTRKSSKPG